LKFNERLHILKKRRSPNEIEISGKFKNLVRQNKRMSNSENTPNGTNNDNANNGNESPDLSAAANNLSGLASSQAQAAVLHAVLPDSVVSEALQVNFWT
jgi:hypothetical protein